MSGLLDDLREVVDKLSAPGPNYTDYILGLVGKLVNTQELVDYMGSDSDQVELWAVVEDSFVVAADRIDLALMDSCLAGLTLVVHKRSAHLEYPGCSC